MTQIKLEHKTTMRQIISTILLVVLTYAILYSVVYRLHKKDHKNLHTKAEEFYDCDDWQAYMPDAVAMLNTKIRPKPYISSPKSIFAAFFNTKHSTAVHKELISFLEQNKDKLNDVDLSGIDLAIHTDHMIIDLSGANLSGSNLQNAKLNGIKLIAANLANTNLIDADLSYTDLTKANMTKADIRGAIFDNSMLTDANMSNVRKDDKTSFNNAKYDSNKKLF